MTGTILLALLPIVLLIGLGAALRRSGFLGAAFWPQAERLGYYVLLPALFVHGLVTAPLAGVPVGALASVLVASTLVVAAALLASRRFLGFEGAAFTSVFQGGVRFNNYVGVSVAAGLFGVQGIALSAVANAAIVPTVNILCVLVFARFGSLGRPSPLGILRLLALNPLVLAYLVGIGMKVEGIGFAPGLEPALRALGQASLPLGLLCVGAALEFEAARRWVRPVFVASTAKFVAMPLATLAACLAFGLHGPAAVTALVFQALPTASSSYIMARQLGGDAAADGGNHCRADRAGGLEHAADAHRPPRPRRMTARDHAPRLTPAPPSPTPCARADLATACHRPDTICVRTGARLPEHPASRPSTEWTFDR